MRGLFLRGVVAMAMLLLAACGGTHDGDYEVDESLSMAGADEWLVPELRAAGSAACFNPVQGCAAPLAGAGAGEAQQEIGAR